MPLHAIETGIAAPLASSVTFTDSASSGTNGTSFDFAGIDIGTAAANRWVVVCIKGYQATAADVDFSSVTIAGETGIAAVKNEIGDAAGGIYYANVPTGTSGTISVVFTNSADRCAIMVYDCKMSGGTPYDTATSVSDPSDLSLSVPAGGIIIGAAIANSNTTVSWTGLDEDVDTTIESSVYSSASRAFTGQVDPQTISADFGSAVKITSVAASWGGR